MGIFLDLCLLFWVLGFVFGGCHSGLVLRSTGGCVVSY